MPLELRSKTEAYRLCQPMHVLSFGEGRLMVEGCVCLRRFGMEVTERTIPRCDVCECVDNLVIMCDTWRHRGRAGGNGL